VSLIVRLESKKKRQKGLCVQAIFASHSNRLRFHGHYIPSDAHTVSSNVLQVSEAFRLQRSGDRVPLRLNRMDAKQRESAAPARGPVTVTATTVIRQPKERLPAPKRPVVRRLRVTRACRSRPRTVQTQIRTVV